ncbi:MAG: Holliday junction resolvase RuvX [Desulfovibrionaceae bacterium]|jgi:putative Holliday junction resolvase|nr:Holliday junction resolvase RuvX [Desulfovibrionaceae bacterium]
MRYLGIDFGLKRVGLALGDGASGFVWPLKTVHRTTRDKLFADILAVIEAEGVQAVVLGLPEGPVAADGGEALIVRQVKNFAKSLARRVSMPIDFMDEFLTSQEAERELREAGLSGQRLKDALDQQAAVKILQAFLDRPDA